MNDAPKRSQPDRRVLDLLDGIGIAPAVLVVLLTPGVLFLSLAFDVTPFRIGIAIGVFALVMAAAGLALWLPIYLADTPDEAERQKRQAKADVGKALLVGALVWAIGAFLALQQDRLDESQAAERRELDRRAELQRRLDEFLTTREDLSGVDLSDRDLRGTFLLFAPSPGGEGAGRRLLRANLGNSNLTNANLQRADLRGATLVDTNLTNANLERAVLRGARLDRAILSATILSGGDLRRAQLVDIEEADLRGANFREADLRGANLSCTSLAGARYLDEADLEGAQANSETVFPDGFDQEKAGVVSVEEDCP